MPAPSEFLQLLGQQSADLLALVSLYQKTELPAEPLPPSGAVLDFLRENATTLGYLPTTDFETVYIFATATYRHLNQLGASIQRGDIKTLSPLDLAALRELEQLSNSIF